MYVCLVRSHEKLYRSESRDFCLFRSGSMLFCLENDRIYTQTVRHSMNVG